jgi:chromosome segregation ATPase
MHTTVDQTMLELNELKSKFNTQQQQLNSQKQVEQENDGIDDMTEKLIQYKIRVHELEETNDSLYQQILLKDNEIEKLIISTPISPPPTDEDHSLTEMPVSNNDVYGK